METGAFEMAGPKSDHSLKHVELSGIPYICCEKAANPSDLVTKKSAATAHTAGRHV